MNAVKWGLLGALFLTACSGGDPVDIGNDEITGEKLEDYVATWDGYIEGANFYGGWDRIRFRLDGSGAGVLHFGEGDPYVPQPGEVPAPASYGASDAFGLVGLNVDFEYPISAAVESGRLILTLKPGQPYDEFCQTLVPDGLGCTDFSAHVVPGSECSFGCGEKLWVVDCAAQAAAQHCSCDVDADSCEGSPAFDRWLDGVLSDDGRELEASIALWANDRYVVRLRRTE